MWVDQKSRKDRDGTLWHFCIWTALRTDAERIFFWDDKKQNCGVVIFLTGHGKHFSRLKQLIEKLLADPAFRKSIAGNCISRWTVTTGSTAPSRKRNEPGYRRRRYLPRPCHWLLHPR